MAWIYELSFHPSGNVGKVMTPSGHSYVLPDGRRVEMRQRYVWCFGCNGFSWAEKLPLVEEVDRTIQTWEDPNSEERITKLKEDKFPDQKQWSVARWLGRAYADRDLLRARTEPCHCTTCRSTEFVEVPFGTEFTLPDGSGTVTMNCVAHASVGALWTYYTPNGHKMTPEEVPPAPPEANFPVHYEWKDYLFLLIFLVTSPLWGPIALLVLVMIGLRNAWDYLRCQRNARATGR